MIRKPSGAAQSFNPSIIQCGLWLGSRRRSRAIFSSNLSISGLKASRGCAPTFRITSPVTLLRIVRSRFDRILQGAMKKSRLVPLLVALAVLGSSSIGSAVQDHDPRQWQVKYTAQLLNRQPYELHNLRRRELDLTSQLGFKEGPRLKPDTIAFTGPSGGFFQFVRHRDNNPTIIKGYQTVAMYNTKTGRYLYYDNKGKFKEFRWDDSPVYQWLLELQCPAAAPQFNVTFSLHNNLLRADLVYVSSYGLTWLPRAGGSRRYDDPCR